MGKTGFICVAGTAQDSMSKHQTTARIANTARSEGHLVVELGGPGSTERSIKRVLKYDPLAGEPSSIFEIGMPMDYAYQVVSGTLFGSGLDDIVRDIREGYQYLLDQEVSKIVVVAFSRGAIAVGHALEGIQEQISDHKGPDVLKVSLLDPVPGPYFVGREIKIPPLVDHLQLIVSKLEGRLGFKHAEISMDSSTELEADLVLGSHTDVGGCSGTSLAQLICNDVSTFCELSSMTLSEKEKVDLILDTLEGKNPYAATNMWQMAERRNIGWSEAELSVEVIPLPSSSSVQTLNNNLPNVRKSWESKWPMLQQARRDDRIPSGQRQRLEPDNLRRQEWTEELWEVLGTSQLTEEYLQRFEAQPTDLPQVIIPERPTLDVDTSKVVYPPPYVAPPTLVAKILPFLKKLISK